MDTYTVSALPGPNNSESIAWGLSLEGHVVGCAFGPNGSFGVRWQGGQIDFSLDANSHSDLHDVNRSGDAVGVIGDNDPTTSRAVLVRAGQVQDLSGLVGKGSSASGINDNGLVCGSSQDGKAFVCDPDAGKVLHWIETVTGGAIGPDANAKALAINGYGNVAGYAAPSALYSGYVSSPGKGFFYKSQDGTTKFLEGDGATDLNGSNIVCGSLTSLTSLDDVPARWDANQAEPKPWTLPLPEGFITGQANGINNHGDVVGRACNKAFFDLTHVSAFIYSHSEDKSVDLNTLISDPDWHLDYASRINDARQIIGYGTYRGQGPMAFLLVPQRVWQFQKKLDIDLPASFEVIIGNLIVGGSGWIISLKGDHRPQPKPGPEPRMQWHADTREALMGLVLDTLARSIPDRGTQEQVRRELLEGVRASVDRLQQAVAESHTPSGSTGAQAGMTPEMKARVQKSIARRFGLRTPQGGEERS
jgi:uncharacterized membrane protein